MFLGVLCSVAFAAPPRPAADRIDAVVGQPIVIRLRVDKLIEIRDGLVVKLDDSRTIESAVFWVGFEPATNEPGWTSPPSFIHATRARAAMMITAEQRSPGAWYAYIPIPLDAVGQGLWIQGERYELNWLPDPARALLEAHDGDIEAFFAPSHSREILNAESVHLAITQLARSPLTRWRARLLLDGLDPEARFIPIGAQRAEGYLSDLHDEVINTSETEAFLEALAIQNEIRWQIILGRIWLIDPQLADRLKEALTRVVLFGDHPMPMWVSSQSKSDGLAHDLLSPWVDDELRAKRARAWLDSLARAAVWVVDDLGNLSPETSRFSPTLGFVSFPPEPGDSLVRIDAPGARSVLETIGNESMHDLQLATPEPAVLDGQTTVPTHQIRIRIGHAEFTRPGISGPITATPPGVRIGPLKRDWTMDALMESNPNAEAIPPSGRTALGVLYRDAPPDEADERVGWTLILQCATDEAGVDRDRLMVWTGAYGHPRAAWSIARDGSINHLGGSVVGIADPRVTISTQENQWTAQITFPRECIRDDLLLTLGIERTDDDGYHSAWPRRMTPLQHEPGRLILDVSRWDGFRVKDADAARGE